MDATLAPTATPAAVTTGVIPATGDTMPVGLLGVVASCQLLALQGCWRSASVSMMTEP